MDHKKYRYYVWAAAFIAVVIFWSAVVWWVF